MIRKVRFEELSACADLIRKSFQTVADEFGITEENAPRFTAFATTGDRLRWHLEGEHRPMFVYEKDGVLCGYYSLCMQDNRECELNNLAVLPEYRHQGIGKELLDHAVCFAADSGCVKMNIGIVEENQVLRKWYERNGAVHTGTKKFDFFPFTCGYLAKALQAPGTTGEKAVFYDTGDLRDEEIMLRLEKTCDADPVKQWVPAYSFDICLADGTKIGYCDLRIGHNDRLYIGGNIGYGIEEDRRGHHYAAKACKLLFRLARKHGLGYVLITCDPDNAASARTCELAGGVYLETAKVPEDHNMYEEGKRQVRVYRFDLEEG